MIHERFAKMDTIFKIPKKPTKFAEKPNSTGLPKVLFNEKNQITKFLRKIFFTYFDQTHRDLLKITTKIFW